MRYIIATIVIALAVFACEDRSIPTDVVPREILDDARESAISRERIHEGALTGLPEATMYVIAGGDTLRAFTVATPEQGMFEWLVDLELRIRALEAK